MDVGDHPAGSGLLEIMRQLRKAGQNNTHLEGFSPSMTRILLTVSSGCRDNPQGMTLSEVSSRMEVTPPTVTQLIKSLEAEDMVKRVNDEEDRRVVRVLLTSQGSEFVRSLAEKRKQLMKELGDFLGEEKTRQLEELLQQVLKFMQTLNKEKK